MPNMVDYMGMAKKICVYGPTGSGKTKLFSTIPGKKFLFVFDHSGLESLLGTDIEYESFFPEALPLKLTTMKGNTDLTGGSKTKYVPMEYIRFEEVLEGMIEDKFAGYDAIGFDSLTTLSALLMDRILWLDNRLGKTPELSDYNIIGNVMINIFRKVLSTPGKIFYITGHDDMVQDQVTKKILAQFDIVKNVRRHLPRLISDMWVSVVDTDASGAKFSVLTMPTKEHVTAKNSMGLNMKEDVTINPKKPLTEQGIGEFLARSKGVKVAGKMTLRI